MRKRRWIQPLKHTRRASPQSLDFLGGDTCNMNTPSKVLLRNKLPGRPRRPTPPQSASLPRAHSSRGVPRAPSESSAVEADRERPPSPRRATAPQDPRSRSASSRVHRCPECRRKGARSARGAEARKNAPTEHRGSRRPMPGPDHAADNPTRYGTPPGRTCASTWARPRPESLALRRRGRRADENTPPPHKKAGMESQEQRERIRAPI